MSMCRGSTLNKSCFNQVLSRAQGIGVFFFYKAAGESNVQVRIEPLKYLRTTPTPRPHALPKIQEWFLKCGALELYGEEKDW